jgi:predicted acylesterase/phospholipase RssA
MNTVKTRLFVWSGGGVPGLDIHAGIWRALDEAGITSTRNSGCSAGAIAAAFNASGSWGGAQFARLIATLNDSDIRSKRFAWQLRMRWIDYIYDSSPIAKLLEANLPAHWEEMAKPCQIWATRIKDGEKVDVAAPRCTSGPREAVLASAAVPMVFAPVTLDDGYEYVDGGLRFNLPLPSYWRDFNETFLLIASAPVCVRDARTRGGLLTRGIRALKILMYDQTQDVIEQVAGQPRLYVIWPNVWQTLPGFLDFDHTLIDRAHAETMAALNRYGLLNKE